MAVGDTQVVQWVNVSFTICDKTPGNCSAAIEGNTFWSALGGVCFANNDGDPIAQYDRAAHRWILTQNVFASPYKVCVAVSTTSDAMGSYYLYQFPVVSSGFPDYPKWGVWPTGYFETWNNFGPGGSGFVGPVLCAYNSAKLKAATLPQNRSATSTELSQLRRQLVAGGHGFTDATSAGQDEFAIGSVGDIDNSHLSMYSAHISTRMIGRKAGPSPATMTRN